MDLLGPTHQRLVIHCLDEAVSLPSEPYRTRMEGRLSQWLLFECSFRKSASLASESEFPDTALHNTLQICTCKDRVTILQDLNSRGRYLSRDTLAVVTTLLQDKESSVRSVAAKAIGSQSNVLDQLLQASGAVLISESSTSTTESVFCHSSFIECLYKPLL
jgi:hypothetical protein